MKTKKQTLAEIGNKVPFKVPENYFSELNDSIMANLPEKEAPVVEVVTMWDKVKPWLYMAAMFLGLFFTIRLITTSTQPNPTNAKENTASTITSSQQNYWNDVSISEEEFFDYIETQFVDEDYYDLVNTLEYSNSL